MKLAVGLVTTLLFAGNAVPLLYSTNPHPPKAEWAIVLGVGMRDVEEPYDETRSRLETALRLWNEQRITRVLVSGCSRPDEIDESTAMADWLQRRGVDAITVDNHAPRTVHTMLRARDVYGIRQATVITNTYHLPRALYLARRLGIEAAGAAAPDGGWRYALRELIARPLAVIEIEIR